MSKRRQSQQETEPIGIIIAQGRSTSPTPRFSAFVWGNVDEPESDPVEVKSV